MKPAKADTAANSKADRIGFAQLWQERARDKSVSEYPIGPGDVVAVLKPANG